MMKVSEINSGSEIGEANLSCFIAMDPKNPTHNVLTDFPECDDLTEE